MTDRTGIIYARSNGSDGEERAAVATARQISACRRVAEEQGITLVGEPLSDISSYSQIPQAISLLRDGQADGVIVYSMDRLGRSLDALYENLKALAATGGYVMEVQTKDEA